MRVFNIKRLEGKGIQAFVANGGKQFRTYFQFAEAAGYPKAVGMDVVDAYKLKGRTVNVLAKGRHESGDRTIYVAETKQGDQFLIEDDGLEMLPTKPKPDADDTELNEAIEAMKKRMYQLGYKQGREDERSKNEWVTEIQTDYISTGTIDATKVHRFEFKTRKDIVRQAIDDVSLLAIRAEVEQGHSKEGNFTYRNQCTVPEFVIDKPKRTVVALAKGKYSGKVHARGIAKCAPDDVFNEQIGKAIALRRAYGLEVPYDYLDAPKPEGREEGDIVRFQFSLLEKPSEIRLITHEAVEAGVTAHTDSTVATRGVLVDDSGRY